MQPILKGGKLDSIIFEFLSPLGLSFVILVHERGIPCKCESLACVECVPAPVKINFFGDFCSIFIVFLLIQRPYITFIYFPCSFLQFTTRTLKNGGYTFMPSFTYFALEIANVKVNIVQVCHAAEYSALGGFSLSASCYPR